MSAFSRTTPAPGVSRTTDSRAGAAIKDIRTAMDLSLRELARLAEVEPSYLSKVERGVAEPSAQWLRRVTDALGQYLAAHSSS